MLARVCSSSYVQALPDHAVSMCMPSIGHPSTDEGAPLTPDGSLPHQPTATGDE